MTRSFYQDTVSRQRATLEDDGYGNLTENWTTPDVLAITGCRVQPLSSKEVLEYRQAGLEVTKRLLAPLGADIRHMDRIVFGETYTVANDPAGYRSPSGVAAHAEVLLRRFDG